MISFYLKSKYPIDEKKMSKLTETILYQNKKINEIKDTVNFYSLTNPVYGNEHIQIITKTPLEKRTLFVANHFLSEDYLKKFVNGDFQGVYRSKICITIIWVGVFAFFTVVLGLTFNFLEITSLNLFPLFSLIGVTISICFVVLNIIQLCVAKKLISGEYQIDMDFMKLFLFKIQKEKIEEAKTEEEGIQWECIKLVNECKKDN